MPIQQSWMSWTPQKNSFARKTFVPFPKQHALWLCVFSGKAPCSRHASKTSYANVEIALRRKSLMPFLARKTLNIQMCWIFDRRRQSPVSPWNISCFLDTSNQGTRCTGWMDCQPGCPTTRLKFRTLAVSIWRLHSLKVWWLPVDQRINPFSTDLWQRNKYSQYQSRLSEGAIMDPK